jgi:hypothetical protein
VTDVFEVLDRRDLAIGVFAITVVVLKASGSLSDQQVGW